MPIWRRKWFYNFPHLSQAVMRWHNKQDSLIEESIDASWSKHPIFWSLFCIYPESSISCTGSQYEVCFWISIMYLTTLSMLLCNHLNTIFCFYVFIWSFLFSSHAILAFREVFFWVLSMCTQSSQAQDLDRKWPSCK